MHFIYLCDKLYMYSVSMFTVNFSACSICMIFSYIYIYVMNAEYLIIGLTLGNGLIVTLYIYIHAIVYLRIYNLAASYNM